MNKKKLLMTIAIGVGIEVLALLLATVSFTYSWFSASVTSNEVKDQVVETGTLSLRYVDGPEIKMENIRPGTTITKTVYVANTGTLDASYNLVWQELTNEIQNDEMVIEVTCTRIDGVSEEENGTCSGISSKPISSSIIKSNVSIEPNILHKYDITITFEETDYDQNYNQGKKFNGVLGVNEFKRPDPIYCTTDDASVTTYTKGPYTYSYKQEASWRPIAMSSKNNESPVFQNSNLDKYEVTKLISWKDIDTDGWGVQLTDKDSTDPVTEAPCTYINGKPVVSMTAMFYESQASSIDLSMFNTSNVTDMTAMFYGASEASYLELSSFDTSNVANMTLMFGNTHLTNIEGLTSFDTSKVESMNSMFKYSTWALELDLSSFDTSNVFNMDLMFYDTNLKTIYVSDKFSTNNVEYDDQMFRYSSSLVGGAGTKYDSSYIDKTYARVDTASTPGYFTLKNS